ncbi:MAG: hypothetical protein ACJASL_003037 [Paraglaciecola sp.]|jgi:hypothetical protein
MKSYKNMLLSITIGLCSLLVVPTSNAVLIDSKLALVIDVSGSVDVTDYALQMNGYAAAFNNATVQANIDSLSLGIAVEVFFFASSAVSASVETLLTSAADSTAFAAVIAGIVRPFGGSTNAASGMVLANQWLTDTTLWESSNLIMDVSTDGTGSSASDRGARDASAAAGITVNGLAIDDPGFFLDGCGLTGYMTENIITSGGLCFQATGFDDFERAVLEKIQLETSKPGPVSASAPGTLALLGFGMFALRLYRKK